MTEIDPRALEPIAPIPGLHYLVDYRGILGLSSDQELDEKTLSVAKKRELAKNSPDRVNGMDPRLVAQATFASRMVNEAYDVLNDPARREAYLAEYARWLQEGLPISEDGEPPYQHPGLLPRMMATALIARPLIVDYMGTVEAEQLLATGNFDEEELEAAERLFKSTSFRSERTKSDIRLIYKKQLARAATHFAALEASLRATIGVPDEDIFTPVEPPLAATVEALRISRESLRNKVDNEITALIGAKPNLLMIGPGRSVMEAGSLSAISTRAAHIDNVMKKYDEAAERIAVVAARREELYRKRLEVIEFQHLHVSPRPGSGVVIIFTIGEQNVFRVYQNTEAGLADLSQSILESGTLTPNFGPLEVARALSYDFVVIQHEDGLGIEDQIANITQRVLNPAPKKRKKSK